MWFLSAGMRRLNNTVIKHRTTLLCSVPKITPMEKEVRKALPKRRWGQDVSLQSDKPDRWAVTRQLHIRIRWCSHQCSWQPRMVGGPEAFKRNSPCFSSWVIMGDYQKPCTIRNLWQRQPSPPKWSLLRRVISMFLTRGKTARMNQDRQEWSGEAGDNGHEEHEEAWRWKLPNFNSIKFNILIQIHSF